MIVLVIHAFIIGIKEEPNDVESERMNPLTDEKERSLEFKPTDWWL
jgi:hypothetical protein